MNKATNKFLKNYLIGSPEFFFRGMLEDMARIEKENRNKAAGIVFDESSGLYGVPSKNIETKYYKITFGKNYYKCSFSSIEVSFFDSEGNFLFSGGNADFLGDYELFIVYPTIESVCPKTKEKTLETSKYGYIYKGKEKKSDKPLFRTQRSSEFRKDSQFLVLGYKNYGTECVINKDGEVVYEKGSYSNLYLSGNILNDGKHYINLLTGNPICEKGYHSVLETDDDELMFVKSEGIVHKINKITGEVESFGKPKTSPQINDMRICEGVDTTVGEILPELLKSSENDTLQLIKILS